MTPETRQETISQPNSMNRLKSRMNVALATAALAIGGGAVASAKASSEHRGTTGDPAGTVSEQPTAPTVELPTFRECAQAAKRAKLRYDVKHDTTIYASGNKLHYEAKFILRLPNMSKCDEVGKRTTRTYITDNGENIYGRGALETKGNKAHKEKATGGEIRDCPTSRDIEVVHRWKFTGINGGRKVKGKRIADEKKYNNLVCTSPY